MKFTRALLACLLYVLAACAVYVAHVAFFPVDVVFYGALADAAIAALLAGAVLMFWRRFAVFNAFEKSQLVVIWLLLGYALAISVPTVIDRSLSFYILEKLEQRGGGIRLASMESVFTREYVREYRLVDVRLTEQQASGTITIANGCVRLTDRGRQLAAVSGFFRRHLLPRERLLMGSYSDDLTHPFRDSVKNVDYAC